MTVRDYAADVTARFTQGMAIALSQIVSDIAHEFGHASALVGGSGRPLGRWGHSEYPLAIVRTRGFESGPQWDPVRQNLRGAKNCSHAAFVVRWQARHSSLMRADECRRTDTPTHTFFVP